MKYLKKLGLMKMLRKRKEKKGKRLKVLMKNYMKAVEINLLNYPQNLILKSLRKKD
uniref:Uncharacterized protein n=1 Tax=Meloidogyne enterolobii TaxID=390850 RepID=A0A6V7VB46_MELEN|nr:unnamed protein product [Meloidogyne enterolobii]